MLLPFAGSIKEADRRLAERVTRELLEEIAAAIPDEWLDGDNRDVYVAYLRGRLEAPPTFVEEAEEARERR